MALVGDSMSLRIGIAEEIKITGIESKIESFAASILFKPIILEPEYTTPALLAPGIMASNWKRPMMSAFFIDNLSMPLVLELV